MAKLCICDIIWLFRLASFLYMAEVACEMLRQMVAPIGVKTQQWTHELILVHSTAVPRQRVLALAASFRKNPWAAEFLSCSGPDAPLPWELPFMVDLRTVDIYGFTIGDFVTEVELSIRVARAFAGHQVNQLKFSKLRYTVVAPLGRIYVREAVSRLLNQGAPPKHIFSTCVTCNSCLCGWVGGWVWGGNTRELPSTGFSPHGECSSWFRRSSRSTSKSSTSCKPLCARQKLSCAWRTSVSNQRPLRPTGKPRSRQNQDQVGRLFHKPITYNL
jgi:hypothetical protein